MQMNQDLLNAISVILTTLFTAVGTVVAKYYNEKRACAKAQASQLENDKNAQLANHVIDEVDDLIRTNIVSVENTAKKAILDGIASGDYTPDKLKELSVTVLNQVKAQLSESGMNTLQAIRNDVNGYLVSRIEERLTVLKNDSYVAVSKTVIPEKKSDENIDNHTCSTETPIQMDIIADTSR